MTTYGDEGSPHRAGLPSLAAFLDAVVTFLIQYVAFPSGQEPVAVALWVAHAHIVERFETSPLLAITSAEMRSGKSRLLECLELLVPVPFRVVTPSEASVFARLSQRPRPTLLLDEADAVFGLRTTERYEGLRAILNSGNRQGAPVSRAQRDWTVREFDLFGAKVIAGIGNLPDTVADRSIPIRLKRRAPAEPVAKFRRRRAEAEAEQIAYESWDDLELVEEAAVPDVLNDRAQDSWEPLLQMAAAAGGSWPAQAWTAAVALSRDDDAPASAGVRLLGDIKDVFAEKDHLTSAELVGRLHEIEDAPWAVWYGTPITPRMLARLLAPYGVRPQLKRVGGTTVRGYFARDLADAWARYVPATVTSDTSVTRSEQPEPSGAFVADFSSGAPALPRPADDEAVTDVTLVTDASKGGIPRPRLFESGAREPAWLADAPPVDYLDDYR